MDATTTKRFRYIRKTMPYVYVDLTLEFESKSAQSNVIHERTFKVIIMSCLKSLFGDFGAAIDVDILKYDEGLKRAFVRLNAKEIVRFTTSLSLLSSWEKHNCVFRILKITHCLSSLSISSFNENDYIVGLCN